MRRPNRSDSVPWVNCPNASPTNQAASVICAVPGATPYVASIAGKAGRYMSMEIGGTAVRKPSSSGSQDGSIIGRIRAWITRAPQRLFGNRGLRPRQPRPSAPRISLGRNPDGIVSNQTSSEPPPPPQSPPPPPPQSPPLSVPAAGSVQPASWGVFQSLLAPPVPVLVSQVPWSTAFCAAGAGGAPAQGFCPAGIPAAPPPNIPPPMPML